MSDQALGFWLRHVEAAGGLAEPAGDTTLVVLPPALIEAYDLSEELHVTDDPDVARDDGVTFLSSGHPVVTQAASSLLDAGDTGHLLLERPAKAPGKDVLLEAARDAFPVDHGRIDLAGEPASVVHPVLRVGALVTYEVSTDDRFQEQVERWVDVPGRRELPASVATRMSGAAPEPRGGTVAADGLPEALAATHGLIDAAAAARRDTLAGQLGGAHDAERSRAIGYYTDAIASIEKRLATAPGDRVAVLRARLDNTRQEQARRLAEIAEKYESRHEIRPYRLHLIGVPALRVPVDVRRGDRRYPMRFDWLLPAGAYAPIRCPACGACSPLVAGKKVLGCETCLAKPGPPPGPGAPSQEPPGTVRPAVPAQRQKQGAKPAPVPGPRAGAGVTASPANRSSPASRPSPPAKVVVPPRIKKAKSVDHRAFLEKFLRALATGHGRGVAESLCAGSPAHSLYRLYGIDGISLSLGLRAGEQPSSYGAHTATGTRGKVISGELVGDHGTETPFYLHLQGGQVAEVVPFQLYDDGSFWRLYWWSAGPNRYWVIPPPGIARPQDPVERRLTATGPGWTGLAVVARALAGWERLADRHDRLLARHGPQALAAAVHRLVAYRAGGRTTFADGAAVYQVDEALMRKADTAMRGALALGPDRAW